MQLPTARRPLHPTSRSLRLRPPTEQVQLPRILQPTVSLAPPARRGVPGMAQQVQLPRRRCVLARSPEACLRKRGSRTSTSALAIRSSTHHPFESSTCQRMHFLGSDRIPRHFEVQVPFWPFGPPQFSCTRLCHHSVSFLVSRAGGRVALVRAVYGGPGRGCVAGVGASGGGAERRL